MTTGKRSPEPTSRGLSRQPFRHCAPSRLRAVAWLCLLTAWPAAARLVLDKTSLTVDSGGAARLHLDASATAHWESSSPAVAEVFQNGFVIGLAPGQARIELTDPHSSAAAQCVVTVQPVRDPVLVKPETLQQYPDSRKFAVHGRTCFGSELNGERGFTPAERRLLRSNRVINPKPLRPNKPLEWEVREGTEVYDGAGVLMGTVAPRLKVGNRVVSTSMFNFGMSKLLHGRLCLYAFSVRLKPAAAVEQLLDPTQTTNGIVATSAWLALDQVVEREALLERIGLGKPGLPALPLQDHAYRITGGDPKLYETEFGELSIVRDIAIGAVPSHYLRRPSGTVNLIYSVPGFGLGGQGLDSFLVSDHLEFVPAKGAKVFVQPTFYPARHPQAGQRSPKTMTFLYGAVKLPGCQPVYGWMAQDALARD